MRRRRTVTRSLTTLGVALGALLLVHAVVAEPSPQSVFSRLEEADARQHHAAQHTLLLRQEVTAQDQRILATLETLDLTRRATEKLRHDLIARQIAWERASRHAQRRAHSTPGASDQLHALLAHAAPRALLATRADHDIVRSLDIGEAQVRALVGQQSSLIVELAQERGRHDAARMEHATTLAQAKKAPAREIDRDLRSTDEALARELALMLKNPSTRDFHRLKGTLIPPVRQVPDHAYGPRKQRSGSSYVRHTGHTYLVKKGTEVRATADGLVVYADRFEGFGLTLIIDHGMGYHSVYAHLDAFKVKTGERVAKSALLASSGESGSLEGPKLYFELRKDGRPINPAEWFFRF